MVKRKPKDELYYIMSRRDIIERARLMGWQLPPENVEDVFESLCQYLDDEVVDDWLSNNLSEYATEITAAEADAESPRLART